MQSEPHVSTPRWRWILLLSVGVALGFLLAATPVYSHVGGTVRHLWRDHIVPRADKRYVPRLEARDRYVPVAYGTTDTDTTTSFQVLGPDELHGVSILNDSDVDEESDMIVANDRPSGAIVVLAPGGPFKLAAGESVEISGADPLSLQAVISPRGRAPAWSIYLWCGFNPTLTGTHAQARCITFNASNNLFG
jgi:hypothetical protein